jgi:hypothetical protein
MFSSLKTGSLDLAGMYIEAFILKPDSSAYVSLSTTPHSALRRRYRLTSSKYFSASMTVILNLP